jgi:hypothetical protein
MRTKGIIASLALVLSYFTGFGQSGMSSIKEMRWGKDFNLHVKLSNDTNYVMDVRVLHHVNNNTSNSDTDATTYYPVNLDSEFIDYIKTRKLETDNSFEITSPKNKNPKTLWSALHGTIGGSYIHFINCLVYALESQHLNLNDPIMVRPVSEWKPSPLTDTYKRTRKWEHYIPYNQKLAQKEYKLRVKENDVKDLQGIPNKFIELFLNTSQKQYEQMRAYGKKMQVAQIDVIRLILGAKYLGASQIEFIQSSVTSSVLLYSLKNLPSVIIFDDYKAAVAMTLDKTGYKIDYVVFKDQETLPQWEYGQRFDKIEALIKAINEANEKVFQKRLSTYYGS